MTLLLDTHTILWYWWDDPQLSPVAKAYIANPANQKLISPASPWEVAIKVRLKKLDIGGPFRGFFPQNMALTHFDFLSVEDRHLDELSVLPFHHRDPFDRLIVAQAKVGRLPIGSADSALDAYGITRIW